MNPRYLAYCRAHGLGPGEMLRRDEAAFPGGRMVGFLCWTSARWEAWRAERGVRRDAVLSGEDHQDFDRWLEEVVA